MALPSFRDCCHQREELGQEREMEGLRQGPGTLTFPEKISFEPRLEESGVGWGAVTEVPIGVGDVGPEDAERVRE